MDQVLNAKDGYSLSLTMLFILLGAVGWAAKTSLSFKTQQDKKDEATNARFDALVCKHQELIVKIYAEHDDRLERLIETHRLGADAMLSKLCDTMNSLEKAMEKRGCNERL